MESQRTDGFAGGIPLGTSATSPESRKLEKVVREATASLRGDPEITYSWRSGYSANQLSELLGVPKGHITGMRPDGGLWSNVEESTLRLATEAKKQGPKGNAVERWAHNWGMLKTLGVARYIVFCSGDGFFDGRSAQRTMESGMSQESDGAVRLATDTVWNTPTGRLWLYRYQGSVSTDEIRTVIKNGLLTP
jgi:hypothetical protein